MHTFHNYAYSENTKKKIQGNMSVSDPPYQLSLEVPNAINSLCILSVMVYAKIEADVYVLLQGGHIMLGGCTLCSGA